MTGERVDESAGHGQQGEGWRTSGTPLWSRLGIAAIGAVLVVVAVLAWPARPGLVLLLGAVGPSLIVLSWLEPNRHRTPPR